MKVVVYMILGLLFFTACSGKPVIPKERIGETSTRSYPTSVKKNSLPPSKPILHKAEREKIHKDGKRILSPTEIFERYSSAVFKIHTSNGYQGSQGSGFFISDNGVAVSNYHVFKGTLIGYEDIILSDGNKYKVEEVYAKSAEYDFIIFKVRLNRLVDYIKIASVTPEIGEKIYTIGSPRGLDNTFSSGEISQIRSNGQILQISAPIDHGSSGGVLLNSYGEAIGITSAGYDDSGANLNFAINIDVLKPYISAIKM